jgi:lipoprotein signal peptidase
MTERTYRWLFCLLAAGGTLLDQVTKYGVFRWLYNDGAGGSWPAARQVFWLEANFQGDHTPYLNPGALFGQRVTVLLDKAFASNLSETQPWLDTLVLSVVSVLAAAGIAYWISRRAAARDWLLCASLGLILAGTLGNLYDRVVFGGVRDFLHFKYGVVDWPIFNLADSCLVGGAFLLLAQAFWTRAPAARTGDTDPAGATALAGAPKA